VSASSQSARVFMQRTRRISVRFRAEEATPPVLAGGDLQLRFAFFGDSLPIDLPARVVRETEHGFAVRFHPLDRRLRQVLSVAIAKAALRDGEASSEAPMLGGPRKRGSRP
jgi:hypothetical protein